GTVRKALDEMTAGNLLVRRQGRGTYVAEHDQEHALFHFFKLTDRAGRAMVPESRVLKIARGPAKASEAGRLALAPQAEVIRIARVRSLAGRPAIFERIVVPAALFPGLDGRALPNTLYTLYARDYGITVARAEERLSAGAAGAAAAGHLAPARAPRSGSPRWRPAPRRRATSASGAPRRCSPSTAPPARSTPIPPAGARLSGASVSATPATRSIP